MNRALIILDNPVMPDTTEILNISKVYDELIVVLVWNDFQFCIENHLKPGEVLVHIKTYFESLTSKPVYLYPFQNNKPTYIQLLMLLEHYCPRFNHIVSNNEDFVEHAELLNDVSSEMISCNRITEIVKENKTRGVFISRAQLFHNGHEEFVKSIFEKYDEIIFIIAYAEKSFDKRHPATAGERMSILKAYFETYYQNRHWIVPMAYNPFIAENFKEIKLLLPHINCLYSTNQLTIEMALFENILIEKPFINTEVRGTTLRNAISMHQCVKHMMPHEAYEEMKRLNIDQRIMQLYNN